MRNEIIDPNILLLPSQHKSPTDFCKIISCYDTSFVQRAHSTSFCHFHDSLQIEKRGVQIRPEGWPLIYKP